MFAEQRDRDKQNPHHDKYAQDGNYLLAREERLWFWFWLRTLCMGGVCNAAPALGWARRGFPGRVGTGWAATGCHQNFTRFVARLTHTYIRLDDCVAFACLCARPGQIRAGFSDGSASTRLLARSGRAGGIFSDCFCFTSLLVVLIGSFF